LHDAIYSERIGTAAVGVMTNKFVSAAELMASVLGMPEYNFAVIDHPVSSASNDALALKAESTVQFIESNIL
jgi:hypothetical protein